MSNNRNTPVISSKPSEEERLLQIIIALIAIAIMLMVMTYQPSVNTVGASNDTQAVKAMANTLTHDSTGRAHWGDCGVDLYPRPESGAAGYCYVAPALHKATAQDNDDEESTVISTPTTTDRPTVITTPTPNIPDTPNTSDTPKKQKCNKGSGNGAEGCDPGNHPENGNNDEGGDRKPDNSNGKPDNSKGKEDKPEKDKGKGNK